MEEKKQMELQVQADEATLSGRYSTMAQVTHTAEEFWIDFFAVLPNPSLAKLLARVIVSPAHAKRLGKAILENVTGFFTLLLEWETNEQQKKAGGQDDSYFAKSA